MKITFIVEGYRDQARIEEVFDDFQYIVLKGAKYNRKVRESIVEALKRSDRLFVMTDPDEPGEKVARNITRDYPMIKEVRVNPEKAKLESGKVKYGYRILLSCLFTELVVTAFN